MQLNEILAGIERAQRIQDEEGAAHPDQTFAFTFPAGFAQRLYLKTTRTIAGLEFVRTRDQTGAIKWMGCFKPRARNAGVQPAHP